MENNHEIYALWLLCRAKQCSRRLYKAVKYFTCPEEAYFSRPEDFDPTLFTPGEIASFSSKDLSKAKRVGE